MVARGVVGLVLGLDLGTVVAVELGGRHGVGVTNGLEVKERERRVEEEGDEMEGPPKVSRW